MKDQTLTDGWQYTDGSMTSIQLYGPACAAITAGEVHTVSIAFVCLAV
jgi:hypothetical protein